MLGLSAILDTWTMVLSGDEEHVKSLLGFSGDPLGQLSQIETKPLVEYRFAEKLLTSWNWIVFAVYYYLSMDILAAQRGRANHFPAGRIFDSDAKGGYGRALDPSI
jgi:hypothetical protein